VDPNAQHQCGRGSCALAKRRILGQMSRYAATLIALCLIGSGTAQTSDHFKRATGEVASELQVCSVYFLVLSSCLSLDEPGLAHTYREMSDQAAVLAVSSFRAVGVSDAVYAAQASLYTEAMVNAMRGDCTNSAVLLQRYSKFCQRLSQDTDLRLKEWTVCARARQRTCGGPGLP
jgi:hypothetical protein